jgi:hypothetical protein
LKTKTYINILRQVFGDILLGNTMVQLILKYNNKYKCYTILMQGYPLFLILIKIKILIKFFLMNRVINIKLCVYAIQRYMI